MGQDEAIKRLKAIFKDRSVLLLPLIKKLDQSLGVRKTLGALHFNKLRWAAEMGEFNERDCHKFAYQISPGLAAAYHKEVRLRRYGPHTVDAMLREWYGRCEDEMSFSRIITTLRDPNLQKESLAKKLQCMHLPVEQGEKSPVEHDQGTDFDEMKDRLGAIPKKEKSKSLGHRRKKQKPQSRRRSVMDQISQFGQQTLRKVTGRNKSYDIEQELHTTQQELQKVKTKLDEELRRNTAPQVFSL